MKFFAILFISLGLFSCKSSDIPLYDLGTAQPLETGRTVYQSNDVGILAELRVKDSLLIAIDPIGEKKFIIINLFTGKEIQKFGESGRGPREFLSPEFLINNDIRNADSSHITLFDSNLSRFSNIDFNRILTDPDYKIPTQKFPAKITGNANLNITDGKIIGKSSSLESLGMFFIYDLKTGQQKWVDFYPNPQNIAIAERNYAFNMHLAAQKDRIIGAMTFLDMIQVFDTTGHHIQTYKFSENIVPAPEMMLGNSAVYFTDVYATPQYCYFIRLGYPSGEENNRKNGAYIIQTDWNGNVVKSYKLKQFLYGFCIDESRNKLLGIHSEDQDTFQIIEYNL